MYTDFDIFVNISFVNCHPECGRKGDQNMYEVYKGGLEGLQCNKLTYLHIQLFVLASQKSIHAWARNI
jgi:hypothetical protein